MENKSHKQILKSTGIVGGAQIFSILIGIIRTKVVAILLGPAGIGLIGILSATIDLIRSATGFGINFSAVKDVAEANASGDSQHVARTITILRRWAFGTGILGMLLTIILCIPLSKYAFGNDSQAISIAIISVTLFISSVSSGQIALLQGLRHIGQMAKATLWGSLLGTAITLPLYWWLGQDGIVPGMILTAIGGLVISWWYARKVKIVKPQVTFSQTLKGGLSMARLGFFIVVNGFIAIAAMYYIRTLILSKLGINSVGYFQAVMTISTLYINILLNSMLADYFPRLSMVHKDNSTCNKLINEQLEITLLLGTPMLLGMITFSSLIITTLYSTSFAPAIPVFQWQIAALFMTLISWPLGVLFLSKNKGLFVILGETIKQAVFVLVIVFFFDTLGFNILGISFFIASLLSLFITIPGVKYLSNFRFSNTNRYYIFIGFVSTLLVLFISIYIESSILKYLINTLITLIISCLYLNKINKHMNIKEVIYSILTKK